MKRGTLQTLTLAIWLSGFIVLQGLVLVAVVRFQSDSFVIKARDITRFEDSFRPSDAALKEEAVRGLKLAAAGPIAARTKAEFKTYLQRLLPKQVGSTNLIGSWISAQKARSLSCK